MSCPRAWQAEAVLDGRLRGAEAAAFERHVTQCATCGEAQRDLIAIAAACRAVPTPVATELGAARLRGRILREANRRIVTGGPRRRPIVLFVASGAAVGALALLLVHRSAPSPSFAARAEPRAIAVPAAPPASAVQAPLATLATASGAPSASEPSPPTAAREPPAPSFERGVAFFRHGDFGLADDELGAFQRALPADPRAEDAAYLRVVARWRMGDHETAGRLGRAYLVAYPEGLRRPEVQRIVDTTDP